MEQNETFAKTRYFIVDMDGTFYLGRRLLKGARRFAEKVHAAGKDFYFFTNNSSNSASSCRENLASMGFHVGEEKIIVSSHVTARYITSEHRGKSVYLLGNSRLYETFLERGILLTDSDPDIVVLGFDTELTYERIRKAANFIANGALYIATHPDKNCPMEDGFMPDTGSMIEMFAASTGQRPLVMGKPETETVNYITDYLSCTRDEIAFVGDRLETDIAVATNHGVPSALVFSGATTREMYERSAIRASAAVADLGELAELI
ncbi:MAG: HAD-IIA family hydrolase [Oscillospiraceae bacterium]|nr:HAD-IIA family hydrolase [Oscillospiraceae bacterium]